MTQHARADGREGWTALPSGLDACQANLTVSLIATPRDEFVTCAADEQVSDVVRRNLDDLFDFLPVTMPTGTIVGLLAVHEVAPDATNLVRDHMQVLDESHTIGADASILSFVRTADTSPLRFVMGGSGIAGLVSLSDLQRLPVRAALFALLTHFEMVMASYVRRRLPRTEDWIGRLHDPARVNRLIERGKREDTLVDALLYTTLSDKAQLIQSLDPDGMPAWSDDIKKVRELRNSLAHANDYASTRAEARSTCATVRLVESWLQYFASASHEHAVADRA